MAIRRTQIVEVIIGLLEKIERSDPGPSFHMSSLLIDSEDLLQRLRDDEAVTSGWVNQPYFVYDTSGERMKNPSWKDEEHRR
jgi:hypothetical protein